MARQKKGNKKSRLSFEQPAFNLQPLPQSVKSEIIAAPAVK
jgi:hypothetical protein